MSAPLQLAVSSGDVAQFVSNVFTVYIVIIFARIVVSWVVTFRRSLPYSRPLRVVVDFLESAVDPYLRLFRRFIPPVAGGRLDLSPILAVLVLIIAQGIVVGLID